MTCAAFSHDAMYVATADMSGLIKVWKVSTQKEVWSFETSDMEVRHLKYAHSWRCVFVELDELPTLSFDT